MISTSSLFFFFTVFVVGAFVVLVALLFLRELFGTRK
jgi:hypothetical protein